MCVDVCKETTSSVVSPVMSASELLQQREQLNKDRKAFYEELAEFEERKRQLAELECRLNKQVGLVEVMTSHCYVALLPFSIKLIKLVASCYMKY